MKEQKAKQILEYFEKIEDPRSGKNTQHKLIDIIIITICAVAAGMENWEEIEAYGLEKQKWLSSFLELPNGIPSHNTIRRLFIRLKPEVFENSFEEWSRSMIDNNKRDFIAIDGKTLRRSHDNTHKRSAVHIVNAFSTEHSIVLGQVGVSEKSNEITAIPELLDTLELKNSIISIDAMGTQCSIADKIRKDKADYVLAVKDNQKNLHEQLKWFFKDIEIPDDIESGLVEKHTTFDMEHGRYERRNYLVPGEIDWLDRELEGFTDVKTIGITINKRSVQGKTSTETRYFISSLEPDAELFAKAVRSHWGIENKVHWVLDMVFREDESRIRKGFSATNMSTIRKITMNILRRDQSKLTLKFRRKKACMNDSYLESLLFQSA